MLSSLEEMDYSKFLMKNIGMIFGQSFQGSFTSSYGGSSAARFDICVDANRMQGVYSKVGTLVASSFVNT